MRSALVGTRTQDPSIKSAVLYQLSYEREWAKSVYGHVGRISIRPVRPGKFTDGPGRVMDGLKIRPTNLVFCLHHR